LAISGTRLYVANRGSNTVSVIDTMTNRLVDTDLNVIGTQSITVGSSPSALAISGTRLYVANSGSNTVSVIDTTTNRLVDIDLNVIGTQSITVGSSPSAVTFSPDGSLAYVANGNDTVSVINTKDYTVFATITIDPSAEATGSHAIALSPDGTRVYVTDAVDRTVRVIAFGRFTNSAPVVSGDSIPRTFDPVTGLVTGYINVRDPDQDQLRYTLAEPPAMGGTATFDQETGAFSYTPSQAARDQAAATTGLDYDTFGVYVSDGISTTYTTVRVQVAPTPAATTPVTTAPVTVGSGPSGSVVSGGYAYVINYDSNNVTVIDTGTNQTVETLDVGAGPLSIAANPQGNRVYVSNSLDSTVSVIDTGTNQVIGTIPIQVLPGSVYNPEIAYDPIPYENRVTELAASGNRLYVNSTDGRITVIDTTNDANTVIRADSLGTFTDLKVSSDGTRLYATSGTSLTVINTSTMTPVSVHVGPTWDPNNDYYNEYTTSIGNVALSPDGKRAYVTYGVTIAERGVGGQSSGYFFTDSQGRSWMVTGGYSAVAVFETDPQSANYNKQIATIIVPAGVQDLAVSPDNSRLYVTSGDGKTVTIVNTTNNAIVGTFATDQTSSGGRASYVPFDWYPVYNVAAFTRYITVSQDGKVYITDYTDGTLYVVTVGDQTIL
jgi:YVTN family beta-propeller protein